MTPIHVRAPASSANLGSAFDAAAVALALYNDTEATPADADSLAVRGEGAEALHAGAPNLALRALDRFYAEIGQQRPALALTLTNRIPLGRGLGSSAAAIAAGLRLGEALSGVRIAEQALLGLAAALEGHGDNTTAALLGGFTIGVPSSAGLTTIRLDVPRDLRFVLFVPEYAVSTAAARAVLPSQTPRADAVFNVGRAALLVAALAAGRPDLLGIAMEDRLHQPYRLPLYRAMQAMLEAARSAGAYGVAVSGAGPSALAIADEAMAAAVAAAMAGAAQAHSVDGRAMALEVEQRGTAIVDAG